MCLSGGGFRAALFHLGGLRRLNEVGLLSQVDVISSVSGGSILSAHLANRIRPWPAPRGVVADWDARVAVPFKAFVRRNIRTWPILNRLLPWNWFRDSTGVETLAEQYERRLTQMRLPALPQRPRFIICAADLAFGANWVFDSGVFDGAQGRMGDYQAGYLRPLPDWPVARAVAASSCFPPVFNPLPLGLRPAQLRGGAYRRPDRDRIVGSIRLSDGGVYDNLGLEPVWKDHQVVLVSDGGATFEAAADSGLFWRLQRYVAVVDSQARALRKRWLIAGFLNGELFGAYWGVGSAGAHYNSRERYYSEELVDEVISEVRTDLDAFSEAEVCVLENHGYLLADAAIQRHVVPLARSGTVAGLSVSGRELIIPHREWLEESRVREALSDSSKQRLLGRW